MRAVQNATTIRRINKGGNMRLGITKNRKTVFVVLSALFLLAAGTAKADANDSWWTITSEEIHKVSETTLPPQTFSTMDFGNCASPNAIKPMTPPSNPMPDLSPLGDISLGDIVNLGQTLWSFIQNSRPVVNARTMTANALPQGTTCWTNLENWQAPRSDTYQVVYKNLFGIKVVNMEFSLIYSYGGQVHGLGRYLMNATVQYRNLQVAWGGFHVNADVAVPTVMNVGTKANPVAGMQLNVHWVVTGLNHIERTASFFIAGDGRPTQQL